MPLQHIQKDRILQRCIACGDARTIAFELLEVATAPVIALPPCAACGSVEYLVGSAEDAPGHPQPGSYGHLHRMLVDHLYSELAGTDADDQPVCNRRPSAEELAQWFPDGLVLADPEPTE